MKSLFEILSTEELHESEKQLPKIFATIRLFQALLITVIFSFFFCQWKVLLKNAQFPSTRKQNGKCSTAWGMSTVPKTHKDGNFVSPKIDLWTFHQSNDLQLRKAHRFPFGFEVSFFRVVYIVSSSMINLFVWILLSFFGQMNAASNGFHRPWLAFNIYACFESITVFLHFIFFLFFVLFVHLAKTYLSVCMWLYAWVTLECISIWRKLVYVHFFKRK